MTKYKNRIEKLYASKGDMKGEIDLVWNPVPGASSYVIQSASAKTVNDWKQIDIVTKSHCTVTGLRSNHEYKFRAASVSKGIQNEWSTTVKEKAS